MKSDFKIVIVDDEVLIAEFLKDELMALGYNNVKLAHDKKQAFKVFLEFEPEIVLLDIRMKSEREGIEIAEEINENYHIPFIYITAHSDREIIKLALATNPSGYITKPFKQIDVYAAIKMVENNKRQAAEKFLIFKEGYDTIRLLMNDILYAQGDDNYIHIYTIQRKYTLRNTLEWFKENSDQKLFQRTHRSYIVNVTKINRTTSKSVFINAIEIPVSRGNKPNFEN